MAAPEIIQPESGQRAADISAAPAVELQRPNPMPGWVSCVATAAALRLVAVLVVPVLPEEAYHWLYARHLDIGYYDHPPMIAWMIALGRLVFGDSTLGIRILPWLCSIVLSVAASSTSRRLWGETAASWTALLLAFQPVTFLGSSFGFPDAPMLMFWSVSLAFLVRALEERRGVWWLAAGAALGAALLSKYTSGFIGVSMLLYLVITPSRRFWLKTPWPYAGILVALLVFSPVIYWNATHHWASFRFQTVGRLEEGRGPHLLGAPAYLLLQTGSVVPLLFPAAVAAIAGAFRTRTEQGRLLLFFGLPMFVFFLFVAISRSTHAFWPLPAWISFSILMAQYLAGDAGRIAAFYRAHWRKVATASLIVAGIGIAYLVKPPSILPRIPSYYGWTEICARASTLRTTLPADGFYLGVGRRYLTPSQMAYHLPAPQEVHAKNLLDEDGMQFTYWVEREALKGRDAVIVAESDWSPRLPDLLHRYFDRVEQVGEPLAIPGSNPYKWVKQERYLFYVGHGYRPAGGP